MHVTHVSRRALIKFGSIGRQATIVLLHLNIPIECHYTAISTLLYYVFIAMLLNLLRLPTNSAPA
jgi:hypothetical protein